MPDPMHHGSTFDERTANNTVRHQYRTLTDREKEHVALVKMRGEELLALFKSLGTSRELSLARTKTEEAVMWAVKHITS